MWRTLLSPLCRTASSSRSAFHVNKAFLHSRNKKAKEYIGKGWSALNEVDRVIGHALPNDSLLIPLLKKAKANFELALEVDNLNTQARFWLARLHLHYRVPGACDAIGVALLMEAANMGNADAQYDLACLLRTEGSREEIITAFKYLEMAVRQLHPDALFLLGTIYLGGDFVGKDLASAAWCFYKASQKEHVGAAIAYGSLILKGLKAPEKCPFLHATDILADELAKTTKVDVPSLKNDDMLEHARKHFALAAHHGNDLAFKWLNRLEEVKEEKGPSVSQ
eukprot:TRINITY_DN10400_c0_g2_i1.p1 TRINITY_DN10400_c0_g2~~TRINITY_DN10400_c0_g2_i1.p1  ORF type:complete len:280 (+),score=58.01 TRINITY_DN10400_c0_g2_i1:220-1059(+)